MVCVRFALLIVTLVAGGSPNIPSQNPPTRFVVDEAILSGVEYIYGQALLNDDHFAKYGHDYLMCLDGVIARTTNPLVIQRAEVIARALGRKWKRLFSEVPEDVNASELSHLMFGLFSLERIGLPFPTLKNELRQAMPHFETSEFLHFDPSDEVPVANFPLPPSNPLHKVVNTEEMVWYNALVNSYVAQKLGLPLGSKMAQYKDILQHRQALLPYKKLEEHTNAIKANDQLYALANLVWTLSDYGRLRLNSADFPLEYNWLNDHLGSYLESETDPTAVAVIVDTLKIFGIGVDNDAHHHSLSLLASHKPPSESASQKSIDAIKHMPALMQTAVLRLLASQNEDGSWGDTKHGEQEVYHPTCATLFALCEHDHEGFGPSIPSAKSHFKIEL